MESGGLLISSNCRLDLLDVESETSLVKLFDKICWGSEFLIFYLVHQTKYLVFFLPPPKKMFFFIFLDGDFHSQSVGQSVTSAYIVRRAFTGLLSDGTQLGGGVIFILVSSVHCQSLLTLICSQFAMFNLPAYNRRSNRRFYRR